MTVVTLPWWEVLVRLLAASVCGGIIGIDRGKKHRPAGFRTHMLVCMGAALTILLSTYLCAMLTGSLWNLNPGEVMITTDVSRFGAQVINGIGFIGAGTIIITGRQQVKGLTTAAGLWASACMGLAIGAGFSSAALIACVLFIPAFASASISWFCVSISFARIISIMEFCLTFFIVLPLTSHILFCKSFYLKSE